MHFNGLKINSALEEFSITSRFLGSKMIKLTFFLENKCFDCSFCLLLLPLWESVMSYVLLCVILCPF